VCKDPSPQLVPHNHHTQNTQGETSLRSLQSTKQEKPLFTNTHSAETGNLSLENPPAKNVSGLDKEWEEEQLVYHTLLKGLTSFLQYCLLEVYRPDVWAPKHTLTPKTETCHINRLIACEVKPPLTLLILKVGVGVGWGVWPCHLECNHLPE
jgi:hypothetical protein